MLQPEIAANNIWMKLRAISGKRSEIAFKKQLVSIIGESLKSRIILVKYGHKLMRNLDHLRR